MLAIVAYLLIAASQGPSLPKQLTHRTGQSAQATELIAHKSLPSTSPDHPHSDLFFRVTVRVQAAPDATSTRPGTSFHVTSQEIEKAAGTFGDLSRYLQLLPGVAFNSDESDDVLVRGGNPIENLYLVDGIPVPNINHIATQGTTGGLVSMIDTSAISSMDFLTGGYDARYDGRLSSVIKLHTVDEGKPQTLHEVEVGFVGAGLTVERPTNGNGVMLLSAHRSLLNLFTDNIGLNGVPIYSNFLLHARKPISPYDSLSILSLGGMDSIDITPQAFDNWETNTIDTQYRGWRVTNGVQWQHSFSERSFGVVTLADSEEEEDIHQQDQMLNNTMPAGFTRSTLPATPVYSQETHDGISDLKYDYEGMEAQRLTVLGGVDARLHRVNYSITQPIGEQTPLSTDPARTDATSFSPHFWVGETGTYVQGLWSITKKWSVGGGARLQTFAFGGNMTLTPRVHAGFQATDRIGLHLDFDEYAQMPPYVYLTAFKENHSLAPIRNRQVTGGVDVLVGGGGKLTIQGYRKEYWSYPVSSEYPTLSLANMVDTLGQEFLWLPMKSLGKGRAYGVEVSLQQKLSSRLLILGNVAYARNKFSGLDGALRPGNFDYPVILNAAGEYQLGKRYELSFRYEYSSGRPYTPFLLAASAAQNRPIYDLSQVNARRGPYYSRLDFLMKRNLVLNGKILTLYGGLQNALDRQNFLTYAWRPRVDYNGSCTRSPEACISTESQMGIFPNFGARFRF